MFLSGSKLANPYIYIYIYTRMLLTTELQERGPSINKANKSTSSKELKWSPPPSNTLKTNVDAHCNITTRMVMAVGV
jgi:hypothetical protein